MCSPLRLASTIGPVAAGIVPLLARTWEARSGNPVSIKAAGTGRTLEKAKSGDFDLVMVHARRLKDKFIADGFGLYRRDVMYNDFIILGPPDDPAGLKGLAGAAEAFGKLASAKAGFVSRGDDSGTHVKEMEIWEAGGIRPGGSWYEVCSDGAKGNQPTVLYAEQKRAYTLTDRATWLTVKNDLTLIPLVEGDALMLNFIAVIPVNEAKFPNINAAGAKAFIDWLVGDEAQGLIKTFGVDRFGEPPFFPNAGSEYR